MTDFKLVISDPKIGKTIQREVKEGDANSFIGLKIGAVVKGESIGLTGYEFEITGGSDYCGFPMRKDLSGTRRKGILIIKGTGLRKSKKGMKKRKTVAGNTIHAKTAQINLKIIKEGKERLFEAKKEGEAKEEKKEVKEEKKPEIKKEAKPAEKPKPEEKPKEKPIEKPKVEEKKEEKK